MTINGNLPFDLQHKNADNARNIMMDIVIIRMCADTPVKSDSEHAV